MDQEYATLFESVVAKPLEQVAGKALNTVIYYVLSTDVSEFDIDSPNTSGGCQGVLLRFDGGEVELDWNSQHIFRLSDKDIVSSIISPTIGYHIIARPLSERKAAVRSLAGDDISGLGAIDATEAAPWNEVRGELLLSVTVWGIPLSASRYSPQAVVFSFPSAEITVAIGMTSPFYVGDGDEVLVLAEKEWVHILAARSQGRLIPFWRLPVN